jgi:hypothetical protein
MMVNNKYATMHRHITNRSKSMNVNKDSQLSLRRCSTCILFLPSEVTTELINTIAAHEIVVTIHYYYHVTPSNTHHPHKCSCILVGSEQVIKNRVTICIYLYIKKMIKIHIS